MRGLFSENTQQSGPGLWAEEEEWEASEGFHVILITKNIERGVSEERAWNQVNLGKN